MKKRNKYQCGFRVIDQYVSCVVNKNFCRCRMTSGKGHFEQEYTYLRVKFHVQSSSKGQNRAKMRKIRYFAPFTTKSDNSHFKGQRYTPLLKSKLHVFRTSKGQNFALVAKNAFCVISFHQGSNLQTLQFFCSSVLCVISYFPRAKSRTFH